MKKNQVSLEKWLLLNLKQEKYHVSLEPLVILEARKLSKTTGMEWGGSGGVVSKGPRRQHEETPTGQRWDNWSISNNNNCINQNISNLFKPMCLQRCFLIYTKHHW